MGNLRVKCSKGPLLTVDRSKQWRKKMVYLLVANKAYKYDNASRKSRIIYIGTTGRGAKRPATSAVEKASEAFSELRGVSKIEVHIVTCRARRAVQTWKKLEDALLAVFRARYFSLPVYNRKKGSVVHPDNVKLFRVKALQKLLQRFGD